MFGLLLRFLLLISLILNGSGFAMASAHLQMTQAGSIAAKQEPATAALPPCHQTAEASKTSVVALPEVVLESLLATAKHPAPDCCESGACHCACMHQAHTVLTAHAMRHEMTGNANDVDRLQAGHPAPALPHLIRPPIG